MSTLGTLAVSIVGDPRSLEKTFDGVNKQIDNFSKKMQDTGKKISKVGKDLSLKVTAPIVAAGGMAFKLAADFEDALGATDQIFKSSAESMKSWADSLESYYGIAKGEALEYANMMGSMLINIGGLTEEQAAKQAQTLLELAGDLTAMYGGTTADAVRALTGALKGNNTMLDNYGMAVNDAMIKTKAMEMGLIGENEQLTLAAKQAATLALIMEQTGAAQGQAAREADGASGTMRALGTEIKNLGTELGQVLTPIITPFIAQIRDLISNFREMSPETQKLIVTIAGIAAAIGPVLIVVGKLTTAVGGIMQAFKFLGPAVSSAGAAISALTGPVGWIIAGVAALVAAIILLWRHSEEFRDGVKKIWETIKATVGPIIDMLKENVGKMMEAMGPSLEILKNAFMDLLPILKIVGAVLGGIVAINISIVIGVINGLIKAIAPLIQAFGGLIAFVTNVVNAIVALFKGDFAGAFGYLIKAGQGLVDFVGGMVNAVWGFISGLVTGIVNFFKNLYNALVGHSIIPDLVNGIISWLKKLPGKALEFARSFVSNMTNTIAALPGRALQWGRDIISSLWTGMRNIFGSLSTWFSNNVVGLLNKLNPFTRHSPSLVDQVWAGAKEIEKAYRSIELPELAALPLHVAPAVASSGTGTQPLAAQDVNLNISFTGLPPSVDEEALKSYLVRIIKEPRVMRTIDEALYENRRSNLAPQGAF